MTSLLDERTRRVLVLLSAITPSCLLCLRPTIGVWLSHDTWSAVGILAMHCAFMRGAKRVIIIDRAQYRLDRAKEVRAALQQDVV